MHGSLLKISVIILCYLLLQPHGFAAPPKDIKLGMSTALSGPAQAIGSQLKVGANIYFEQLNKNGGINGAKVDLLVLDDGYEPSRTVNNTRYFIYEKKVDALFSFMGTPTISAIRPLLEHSKISLLMPFSGADFLRDNRTLKIFNLRPSYFDEAEEQINYLVNERKHKNIALFIQADEFGITLEKSLTKVLADRGLTPSVITRFRRNSSNVDKALSKIKASRATAVALIGTYKPLAKFINRAQLRGVKADYTSVSFASSKELLSRIKSSQLLMITEVVPNPYNCSARLCNTFRTHAAAYPNVKIDHVLFEGYLNALLFSKAATQCPLTFSDQCILDKLSLMLEHDADLQELFNLTSAEKKLPVFRSYSS
ncbi:ABC transporter substrate-binding protein [Pseudoalteromonas aurantia]|uniref:Branched-chain amino acid transport system substrate-binding protein n=1 Tax=Pseudoalteromonas aurantia 208 TaxID=1314867 RepID=A0ABR9EGA3_9GAMM|nr:ABC transporter substrate-binding protein [Pseudoalteromonas aurantia]MBE0369767.1 branched-chain amino acid transport system substrate-binding protein [Pseudoalteromonas aurantia 208]